MPPILFVATKNSHKAREIQSILGAGFRVRLPGELGRAPEVVEDAPTFEGNAVRKAEGIGRWLLERIAGSEARGDASALVLADDSGLEVDALDGSPGVHSARFAALDADGADAALAGNTPDAANNAKLLRLMAAVPEAERGARFRCVLALVRLDGLARGEPPAIFEGVCEGRIGWERKGEGGFGYDPLFIPRGHDRTFAQLGEDVKNGISHRARALAALQSALSASSGSAKAT